MFLFCSYFFYIFAGQTTTQSQLMIMAKSSFFKPYRGEKYETGINGKKILVVGASFYCTDKSCKFFTKCTDVIKKDSSKYDDICPDYVNSRLSELPEDTIGEGYKTYKVFANFISQYVDGCNCDDVWNHLAFTNYVQFILPTKNTYKSYLSERDFNAFIEVLTELKPDIVISWGVVCLDDIRTNNPYVFDKEELVKSDHYISHMRIPGVDHDITLVSGYHPGSIGYWYGDLDKLSKYFQQALEE